MAMPTRVLISSARTSSMDSKLPKEKTQSPAAICVSLDCKIACKHTGIVTRDVW